MTVSAAAGFVLCPLALLAGCAAQAPSRTTGGGVVSPAGDVSLHCGLGELDAIESGPAETPGSTVRLQLPGPCVSLRKRAAQDPLFQCARRPFDLDGDGVRDVVIEREGGAAHDAPTSNALYVLRGRCAHLVGEISGQELSLLPERSGGLADILARGASVHYLCPKETDNVWRFDGRRYTLAAPPCPAAAASQRQAPP
jgi:hypothetical protein